MRPLDGNVMGRRLSSARREARQRDDLVGSAAMSIPKCDEVDGHGSRAEGNLERDTDSSARAEPGWRAMAGTRPTRVKRRHKHGKPRQSQQSRTRTQSSNRKHGEPHDRQQGATNLQADARRKPSKPRERARTERAQVLADLSRRSDFGPVGSGRAAAKSVEGRIWTTPRETLAKRNIEHRRAQTSKVCDAGERSTGNELREPGVSLSEMPRPGSSRAERNARRRTNRDGTPQGSVEALTKGGARERPTTRTPNRPSQTVLIHSDGRETATPKASCSREARKTARSTHRIQCTNL